MCRIIVSFESFRRCSSSGGDECPVLTYNMKHPLPHTEILLCLILNLLNQHYYVVPMCIHTTETRCHQSVPIRVESKQPVLVHPILFSWYSAVANERVNDSWH